MLYHANTVYRQATSTAGTSKACLCYGDQGMKAAPFVLRRHPERGKQVMQVLWSHMPSGRSSCFLVRLRLS